MVVALGVVPTLGRNVEPLRAAFAVAGGHHLNPVHPDVPHERRIRLGPLDLGGAEDLRQVPPDSITRLALERLGHTARFGEGMGAERHEFVVADALTVPIDERSGDADARRGVGEVDEVAVGDMDAIDVPPDLLDQRLVVDVDGAVAGAVQQVKTIVQRCAGPAPVARPLVAAAIVLVGVEEMVQAAGDLRHRRDAPTLVGLDQQCRDQPVGVAPGVPVVDAPAAKAHPAEVALQARRQNAPVDLQSNPLANQGRNLVEPFAQQIAGPGKALGCFSREQIDDRFGIIRQTRAGFLRPDVRGHAPEGLLTKGPDAVGDVVKEASLAFDALGDRQGGQRTAPGEMLSFVPAAVAVAGKLQEQRRRQCGPVIAEIRLAAGDQVLANLCGQPLPRLPLAPLGPRAPLILREKHLLDLFLWIQFAEFEASLSGSCQSREHHQQQRTRCGSG